MSLDKKEKINVGNKKTQAPLVSLSMNQSCCDRKKAQKVIESILYIDDHIDSHIDNCCSNLD